MTSNEAQRLHAVKQFIDFDFDLNKNLKGLLKLATEIYETPVAFLTLIDEQNQWFKVRRGFDVFKMPRSTSFCTHAIRNNVVMVVPDALKDERFVNNPLVTDAPNIRFYAGAPLATSDGNNIGTLCVMDTKTREVPEKKRVMLEILAKQAIHLMEMDMTYKLLNEKMELIEHQNKVLMDIAFIQSHEFRGPLTTIMGLMNLIKMDEYENPMEYLLMMEESISKLDEKIHLVVNSTYTVMNSYS